MNTPLERMDEEFSEPSSRYRLTLMAEERDSVEGYIVAWGLSSDAIQRHYFFQRAIQKVRDRPTRMGYSRAYLFSMDIGSAEVAQEMLEEFEERYPFFFMIYFLPLGFASFLKRK